jgi:hypothetical protein
MFVSEGWTSVVVVKHVSRKGSLYFVSVGVVQYLLFFLLRVFGLLASFFIL